MKAVLMNFGYIVSSPLENHWFVDQATAEAWIEREVADGAGFYDRDDFTVTEVFAKAWRGNVLDRETNDWEKSFKENI